MERSATAVTGICPLWNDVPGMDAQHSHGAFSTTVVSLVGWISCQGTLKAADHHLHCSECRRTTRFMRTIPTAFGRVGSEQAPSTSTTQRRRLSMSNSYRNGGNRNFASRGRDGGWSKNACGCSTHLNLHPALTMRMTSLSRSLRMLLRNWTQQGHLTGTH